jgi:Tfp pilus assembly protein PilX
MSRAYRSPTNRMRHREPQRGSALVMAIIMVSVVGMLASVALTYADAGLKASYNGVGPSGDTIYAADSAVDLAVKYLRNNTGVGVAGASTCGDSNNASTVFTLAANGNAPAVDVKCQPASDSGTVVGGSGGVSDSQPGQAILALGTRNGEPGPYNNDGNTGTVSDSSFAERGIDLQKSSTGGTSTLTFTGNVVSNAPVRRGATAGALAATGTISARGACENVSPCTVVPYTTGATPDPGYPYRTPTLTQQTVPSCYAGSTIKFTPGWYSSASALNNLFATCKDKDFWFQPGTYYFDFRDTSGGTQCRPHTSAAADALHEWCIGPYADSKAKVIGGTQLGWTASPANVDVTSNMAAGGSYPATWTNQQNGAVIDGSYSQYNWNSTADDEWGGGIYPATQVPANALAINSVSVDVTGFVQSGTANKTVWVAWGNAANPAGLNFCPGFPAAMAGNTVTLNGLETCLNTPAKLNSAVVAVGFDTTSSTGQARFDGARIRYNYTPAGGSRAPFPNGCDPNATGVQFIFGGDSRVYVSDGSFELCAGPNPGGSTTNQQIALYGVPALNPVKPTAAGAVSGQSWVNVANASNALAIGEQSGIASATITFDPGCGWDPGQIFCLLGFGSGTAYGSVRVDFPPGQFSLPANTTLQNVKLRASYRTFDGISPEYVVHQYQNASGWSCSAVSSLPASGSTTSVFADSIPTSCLTAARLNSGFSIEWRMRDNAGCLLGFCSAQESQTLDGLQVLVDIAPATAATAVVMPQDGCIVPFPNDYASGQQLTNRYGMNTYNDVSAPDCALLRWDAVPRTTGTASQIGCYSGQVSIQGTVYAPSAAVDFDQAGPKAAGCSAASPTFSSWSYPIFNRGAIVRTLRVRGMRDPSPHAIATCGTAACGGSTNPRDVTLTAQVGTRTRLVARVVYPIDGSAAQIKRWTVSG